MRNLIKFGLLGPMVVTFVPGRAVASTDGATTSFSVGSATVEAHSTQMLLARAPSKKGKGKAKGKRGDNGDAVEAVPALSSVAAPAAPEPASPAPVNLPRPPPLPDKYRAVAVLPVQGQDVPEEMVRGLEQSLMSEVDETEGMRAVSPLDIKNDLSSVGIDPSACQGQVACVARAGRYARAHLALDAKLASIGGTLSISLRLFDTEKAVEVSRVADPVSEDVKQRAQDLHRMAVQLLAPETYIGSLTIEVTTDGAEVFLDDKQVGTTPLKGTLDALRAGPHILRVTKPGFADVNQFVDVVYKRNATVSIDLANNTIGGLIVEVESKTGFGELWVVGSSPGLEIRVDGEPKGVTPLAGAIVKVAAGKRRVSFRGENIEPQVQEVEIKANTRVDIALTVEGDKITLAKRLESSPGAPTPSYDDMIGAAKPSTPAVTATLAPAPWTPGWRFYAGVVTGGLAVVGLGVGSFYGNRVRVAKSQARALSAEYEVKRVSLDEADQKSAADICKEAYADGTCRTGRLARTDSTGKRAQVLELASFGVGAVLAAAAVGFVLWDMTSTPQGPAPQTSVSALGLGWGALSGGGQLLLSGQF